VGRTSIATLWQLQGNFEGTWIYLAYLSIFNILFLFFGQKQKKQ
jgi:hypothetical protein